MTSKAASQNDTASAWCSVGTFALVNQPLRPPAHEESWLTAVIHTKHVSENTSKGLPPLACKEATEKVRYHGTRTGHRHCVLLES